MRDVGLILCDHLDPPVADRVGDYPQLFADLFSPLDTKLTTYDATAGIVPDDPGRHQGWVISGSRASVGDNDAWIAGALQFAKSLLEHGAPTLGVCFGHVITANSPASK